MAEKTIFDLKKGDIVDFHSAYLVTGFPVPNFNILSEGPFEVTEVYIHKWTREYTIKGAKYSAFLECEKEDGEVEILIMTRVDKKFPRLMREFLNVWNPCSEKLDFNGVTYYRTENDTDECVVDGEKEEYEYWDFYSDPIDDGGQKLFIGMEDYCEDPEVDDPEYELLMGFTIPERAVKGIISP